MNNSRKLLFAVTLVLFPILVRGAAPIRPLRQAPSFAKASADRQDRPNIVLIVVDDLGYADLSCTGLAEDVQTPNIDKLAERGVRFTNAYATAPICNASRVSIMTGCYQ